MKKIIIFFVLLISTITWAAELNDKEINQEKEKILKKWRRLTIGMDIDGVQRILGKPKLIQSGSDEIIWFYQDIPTQNALPNFDKNKIGLLDIGGIKNGIVFFQAKSRKDLNSDLKAKANKLIAKEKAKRDKAVADANNALKKQIALVAEQSRIYRSAPESEKYYEKRKLDDLQKAANNLKSNIKSSQDNFDRMEKNINANYEKQVKEIDEKPRKPEFILKFFNQPDWNRIEELASNKADSEPNKNPTEKWKSHESWKKLHINMSANNVHSLLGEPNQSEVKIEGRRESYGTDPYHGQLYFSVDDELKERLDSWTEPFWPGIK